jgi:hypothetical protein
LGITCAATETDDGVVKLWHGGEGTHEYAPKMTPAQVGKLIDYLEQDGRPVVTWNGLGFDFDVVAEESFFEMTRERVRNLALGHIDIAFQMFCEKGFMCGLDAAAKGQGVGAKLEGMSGAKAPIMWRKGRKAQDLTLQYVAQDASITAAVYRSILDKGLMRWVTKRGGLGTWVPTIHDGRLLTCRECLDLPLPDTSWMDDPWPREKFAGWVLEGD